ncbi:GOGB1 protein, partial [Amia calva]|nr:GOGB1 protein [Amia calva]
MRDRLEAAERERDEEVTREREVAAKQVAELCFLKERLESAERERDETVSREGEEAARMQAELLSLRDKLEATERESNKSVVREPNKEEELSSLKERLETAERERDEAVMREREEIARMDGELNAPKERLEAAERLGAEGEAEERERKEEDSGWEAEIAALKEHLEMAERERDEAKTREREEATRREEELRGLRERMEEMERERDENATSLSFLMPEREREEELSTLRERLEEAEGEREKAEQRAEALADVWRGLSTLMGLPQRERDEGEEGEEASLPTDPALCVSALQGALRALESRLAMMREERQESEARCFQLSFTLEAVQGELCKSTAEVEEAVTRIRQLEQQIATQQVKEGWDIVCGGGINDWTVGWLVNRLNHGSTYTFDLADISIVSVLERRLVEQEEELVSLRSQLAVAKGLNTGWKKEYKKGEVEGTGGTENTAEGSTDQRDASTERQDSAAQNKESSIVSANLQSKRVKEEEDTVSGSEVLSANTEVLQTTDLQLEVTVQRSSSGLDNICSMEESVAQAKGEMAVSMVLLERSKSWEGGDSKTCLTESRTVSSSSFSSSSVVTVLQERSTKAWDHQGALLQASDSQELMGELKVRCEELRVVLQQREEELQSLREVAMESQRRAHEVELQLDTARAELSHTAQCRNSALESQQLESGVLEEQLHSLHTESRSKDLKIQALQTDLDHAQHCLAEQEGQGHVLLAQLEEKKRAILEVERRLKKEKKEKEDELQSLARERKREHEKEREEKMLILEAALEEARQALRVRDALLDSLQVRVNEQDRVLAHTTSANQNQDAGIQTEDPKPPGNPEEEMEKTELDIRLASLESERETLQKKLQEALTSRKDTIRKAQEKDRHHREQLKQQKEEYSELLERCKEQGREKQGLLLQLRELEEMQAGQQGRRVAAAERDRLDQRGRLEACETELRKLREEREKLIQEVDRTLLENQSLGDSCESLKLAMDGVLAEKNSLEKEAKEYETLLRSYENVSDEAERVRRVLEAARQERQELVARVRSQEVARREAEERTEEARQEVETVKDKMRKFAKSKQQKILELEEENHQLREREERAKERAVKVQKGERQEDMEEESRALERAREELESLAAELEHVKTQRDLQEQEAAELRQKLAEEHAQERQQLQMELRKTQQGLEEVLRELEREKVAVKKARTEVEGKEGQVRQLQGRLDEALSGLAAFSHSMSSLQDDRDRVLDEAKLVKELVEQLQSEMAQKQELQGSVDRFQTLHHGLDQRAVQGCQGQDCRPTQGWNGLQDHHLAAWLQQSEAELQHHLEETEARHMEAAARLEGEIAELKKSLVQMEGALVEAREELASVRVEEEGLRQRTQALEDAVSDLQHEADALRVELREHEAEQLQVELAEKEKREVELLEEKEQAVSQATEEARQEAEARAHEAEREVAVWRDEARRLEEKARKAEEDCSLSKAQLEAFTKAMGSLQDDRDRVLGEYKQLEERHLQVMVEKDSVIQEAATENNSLKGELRSLLSQRDDLNAEKAKLSAELHGYRDELTQVLSMKDSQSKQLLSAQLERIRAMERDLEEMIVRVKELEREREEMEGKVKRLNEEREEMVVRVKELEREREEMEGRERGRQEMEERVREREEMECQLRDLESRIEELEREKEEMEGTITTLEQGKQEAEGSVLRTEAETAQERVAELSRDLVQLEQSLLVAREEAAKLREQNHSFAGAMASLQTTRDQALEETQALQRRLKELEQHHSPTLPSSPPGRASGEVQSLRNALAALQSDRERMVRTLS